MYLLKVAKNFTVLLLCVLLITCLFPAGKAVALTGGEEFMDQIATSITQEQSSITELKYGDLNADNNVDSLDLTLMKRFILKTIDSFSSPDDRVADLDGDGGINSLDLTFLKRYILKIINVFPEGTTLQITKPDKICALTFDDGPDTQLTALVLDKLDKYDVDATFFMVGQRLNDSTSAIVKRVVDSGCEIGNHSWSYSGMGNMSSAEVKKSIDDTTAAIQKYSGTTPKFFRPPYLQTSSTMFSTIDLTFASGIVCYDWDQSTSAEARANYIINGVKDGAIILMHDVQPLPHPTPEALDIIIPELKKQGYEFVTLSELFRRKGVALDPSDNKMYVTVP